MKLVKIKAQIKASSVLWLQLDDGVTRDVVHHLFERRLLCCVCSGVFLTVSRGRDDLPVVFLHAGGAASIERRRPQAVRISSSSVQSSFLLSAFRVVPFLHCRISVTPPGASGFPFIRPRARRLRGMMTQQIPTSPSLHICKCVNRFFLFCFVFIDLKV